MRTLVIPDTHTRPEQKQLDHFHALGAFIKKEKPEHIVWIGDHWDLPSIFYDKRAKRPDMQEFRIKSEGRRLWSDIEAGKSTFDIVQKAIQRTKGYNPEQDFCEGNHEFELRKFFDSNPVIENPARDKDRTILSRHAIEEFVQGRGVNFHPYLSPVLYNDVVFSHCFMTPGSKNAVQINTAHTRLFRYSHVWGHTHTWGYRQEKDTFGEKIFWLCSGMFAHPDYCGRGQWSGVTMLEHLSPGECDVNQISVERLLCDSQ